MPIALFLPKNINSEGLKSKYIQREKNPIFSMWKVWNLVSQNVFESHVFLSFTLIY